MNNNAKLDHIPRDESIGVKRSESSVEKLDIFHVKGQPERCCDVALQVVECSAVANVDSLCWEP
jgi:hypothetical protein